MNISPSATTLLAGTLFGRILSENQTHLTLRQLDGSDRQLSRKTLKSLKKSGRSFMPEGLGSAMSHQDLANLVISKIHYHPSDDQGELSEFVELMNISDQAVDLSGVAFTQGVEFAFGDTASLAPGQRAVLVADPAAFEAAFGAGAKILGTFASRLSDGGERLTLTAADGAPLQSLSYNDSSPWPGEPDGGGYSLVLISPQSAPDHELPQNWRASLNPGGDPGSSDATLFTGDPATDLLDYALGDPEAVGIRVVDGVPVFEFPRVLGADDVTVSVELSSDLITWSAGESELLGQSERVGDAAILQWSLTKEDNSRQYARIVVSLNP
ncbi:lamin tail domain-containing protein [Akkermansiaceae bacterium]|nr:lamin tail domain-containing protein [Akkermansiaceae bacterium]